MQQAEGLLNVLAQVFNKCRLRNQYVAKKGHNFADKYCMQSKSYNNSQIQNTVLFRYFFLWSNCPSSSRIWRTRSIVCHWREISR